MNSTSVLDTVIEKGILFLLVFTPLAFGGVQDWATAVMELAAFVVLAAWLLKTGAGGRTEGVRDRRLLLAFSVAVFFVVLQLIPLPEGVLQTLSPTASEIYRQYGLGAQGTWRTVSIYPRATIQYLLKLLAYGAIFFVVINHYREREQVERLVRTILIMAFSLVVFALVQKATWNNRIFWLYPVGARDESVRNFMIWGAFINRNHFAGYLEMAIPLGLGLMLYGAAELRTPQHGSLVGRTASFLDSRWSSRIGLWGVVTLILISALFMTLSRGGIIAFLCSAGLLAVLARMRQGLRKKIGPLVLVGLLLVLMLMIAGWDRIEERFEQLGEEHSLRRADVWLDSLSIVKDFSVLGTGFGTYTNIYPRYQSHSSTVLYDHAHNDYVELLTDMGLPGFAAFLALAVLFLVTVIQQWRVRHRAYVKALGAGGIASCAALFVHGLTDFNLHIPSNALLLTVVAGITYTTVFHVGRREA